MKGFWSAGVCLLIWISCPLAALNIGAISFEGVDNIDAASLQQASGLTQGQPYDPLSIPEAINRIYAYLQGKGRYFVQINAPELIPLNAENLELLFTIKEVLPSDRVRLHLQGMQYFSQDKLLQLLLLTPLQEFRLEQIPLIQNQILSLYHNRGYLFAKVQLDSLVNDNGLIAHIGISEGKPMRVKEYIFWGNKTTKDKTLLYLSGLQGVQTITPDALSQAEENIMRKSYIRDCLVQPLDESSILIRVEEGRMTFLEGVLGMTRINEELKLSGQVRLQFLNLWGSDRAVKLYWKRLPTSSGELSLSYHESGFPGIPVAADIEINRIEQDSTWIKSKTSLLMYYQMLRQNTGLELSAESIQPGSRRPVQIDAATTKSIGVFWNYSQVLGASNPYKGTQINLLYRLGNSDTDKHLSGATEAGFKGYVSLTNRFVGYAGIQVRNLENKNATDWQLYKMGGYNSLRGFREDEYASYRLAWTNYELRYRLSPDSRVYLLFDQGFLGLTDNRLKYDILGLGAGIKVKTKLGILGIEYALGYRDKRFSSLGLGMIHAGLDLAF